MRDASNDSAGLLGRVVLAAGLLGRAANALEWVVDEWDGFDGQPDIDSEAIKEARAAIKAIRKAAQDGFNV